MLFPYAQSATEFYFGMRTSDKIFISNMMKLTKLPPKPAAAQAKKPDFRPTPVATIYEEVSLLGSDDDDHPY